MMRQKGSNMKSIKGCVAALSVFFLLMGSGCRGISSADIEPQVSAEPEELAVPAPAKRTSPDGSAYLFVHFIGESPMGEQIYFTVSTDGLHWTDLNNSAPVLLSNLGEKGVRDPAIIRAENGKFYILATDLRIASGRGWDAARFRGSHSLIFWESDDLIHWSEPWSVEVSGAVPDAGCTWAPEAIYDDATGEYVVYWAIIAPKDGVREARIYSSRTKDFHSFTPAELYIERSGSGVDGGDIIDTQILKVDDGKHNYYRVSRDTQITVEAADSIFGDWTRIGDLSRLGYTARDVEGPIIFQFNNEQKWCLLVDRYATGGGYMPVVTSDLADPASYQVLRDGEYSMGTVLKRHGGVLNISQTEYNALLKQWPSVPVCRIESVGKPGQFLRHWNYHARIDTDVSPVQDGQWRMVPALNGDANGAALQSVNFPDRYLVPEGDGFGIKINDGSAAFAADASFVIERGLAGPSSFLLKLPGSDDRYMINREFGLTSDPLIQPDDQVNATFRAVK